MKSYKQFVTEIKESQLLTKEEVSKAVHKAWNKYFKRSYASSGKTALPEDGYSIFTFAYGKDNKDFKGGIFENDPLSLMITIEARGDKYVIEYPHQSITIKPTQQYMVFGSEKLKLRKTTVKNTKALETKLDATFKKVYDTTKQLLKSGEFDVHGEDVVKMITSKL